MPLQINSGIERARILQWLEQELGVTAVQRNVYMLDGCTITLQPLPPGVLPNIPRTLVTFTESCHFDNDSATAFLLFVDYFLHLFVINYASVVDGLLNKCSALSFHRS